MADAASIPRDPSDDYGPEAVGRRLDLCAEEAGRRLPYLAGEPVPTSVARGNVENLIGYAQVPVGLAGPLWIDGGGGERRVFVPLATNEGAMVAAYSRGMKALAAGGPVRARVVGEGLTQAPILVFARAADAQRAAELARASVEGWRALVAERSAHGRLDRIACEPVGRRLVLRLWFTTGDAVGINMAAGATDAIARDLAARAGAEACYVHGEDVEKRANGRALSEGRGRSVIADACLPAALVRKFLRVEPADLAAIGATYAVGFARLGTQNHLVQAANGLTALFIACGQDAAYVTESATGHLDLEVDANGDLVCAATLPSLLVGTVGGGSNKGTAAECLDVLGVRGDGGANAFAEICAATVLAGDLSLMASFCAGDFVAAHERLGRNRPEPAGGTA